MKYCMCRNKCTDLEDAMHWKKWEVGKYGYHHPTCANLILECTLVYIYQQFDYKLPFYVSRKIKEYQMYP